MSGAALFQKVSGKTVHSTRAPLERQSMSCLRRINTRQIDFLQPGNTKLVFRAATISCLIDYQLIIRKEIGKNVDNRLGTNAKKLLKCEYSFISVFLYVNKLTNHSAPSPLTYRCYADQAFQSRTARMQLTMITVAVVLLKFRNNGSLISD